MELEICCNSIQSAVNAKNGGAERIELCQDLEGGGTTPSAATIDYCVNVLKLHTRVLIRPRRGNFYYNNEEYDIICRDVDWCRQIGAHAVVVGFLNADGYIDFERTAEIVRLAYPMQVTFHRAFDEQKFDFSNKADIISSLDGLIESGCHKLLTSGCASSALEGVSVLKKLVEHAAGKIDIIAAAGIIPANVLQVVSMSGVKEVHCSCKHNLEGKMETDLVQVKNICELLGRNN